MWSDPKVQELFALIIVFVVVVNVIYRLFLAFFGDYISKKLLQKGHVKLAMKFRSFPGH